MRIKPGIETPRGVEPASTPTPLARALGALQGARSLGEIGAQLKAIAAALPDVTDAGAAAQVAQAAGVAFRGEPTGLRALLAAAAQDDVKLFLGTAAPADARRLAKDAGLALGAQDFKLFSTGDPFSFLGRPGDHAKGVEPAPEDVAGKTVYVLQGLGGAQAAHDLPTLVAEALQIAAAAIANQAERAVLVLPDALDPARHPGDRFAALVHTLARASGVDAADIHYVRELGAGADAASALDVRQGLPPLGPKTGEVVRALEGLERAADVRGLEQQLRALDLAIAGLEGQYPEASVALAKRTADVLAARVAVLVPDLGAKPVLDEARRTVVLAGQSNVALAEDLAQRAGAAVGVSRLEASATGAPRVDFGVGVAGKDVVIVQTTRPDPDAAVQHSTMAHLAEALLLFQSAVERGARDVKLVLPYMTNARSDKIDQKGVAAYGSLVARWIDAVVDEGRKVADARGQRTGFRPRVVLVEPHDPHTPYFFRTPVDVVSGGAVLATRVIDDVGKDGLVLVRPDEGAAKRTAVLGKQLGLPVVNGQKSRADNNETATIDQLGSKSDVDGKKTLIIDDEIATGGTMRKTVAHLRALGATEVHVAVTHANMPLVPEERHEAMRKLKEAGASRLYLMDTQPVGAVPADLRDFVVVVPSADAIATTARLTPRGAQADEGDDA